MAYRLRQAGIGLFLCVLADIGLGGQTPAQHAPTGITIDGLVVDRDQGVVPGVLVTLKHDSQTTQSAVTDTAGKFRFTNVPPGPCVITAALAGFKTTVLSLNVPGAGGTMPIRIPLVIGTLAETVEVQRSTTTISTEFIQTLPRADRNVLNYLVFLPADSSTVSGLPQNTTNITIDGVNRGNAASSDGFFTRVTPRQDATSAVTLNTATGASAAGQGASTVPFTPNTETYARFRANRFKLTSEDPLSTFAADVDTASYTNVRRFLQGGQLPPTDAVRVEELINYFRFAYPSPARNRPVSVTAEIGDCPWAPAHKLALIGVRARAIDDHDVRGRNIVLLVDVSGSMAPPERLPLVKTALRMFVDTLRPDDRIAMVTYAGASGLALPATRGSFRGRMHDAIASLEAGGSTNGGEGLVLAYRVARENFVEGGVNRVILATDGDFNVGVTSEGGLHALIEREKASGVFLSVLGVGSGNLKDRTMEMLADKGNGHYAYLDSLQEARRVLVREGGATLETVAKDVKFQVEFNPAQVAAWRLIGYETRLLAHQDFNDDRKDGGELGAGHTVTVLYEIVPPDVLPPDPVADDDRPAIDPLRYQAQPARAASPRPTPVRATAGPAGSAEILTVKVRYKRPDAETSDVIAQPVRAGGPVRHLPFAAIVAEFGLMLRSPEADEARWMNLGRRLQRLEWAGEGVADRQGFAELVGLAAGLKRLR
jgi:Ca-activated chloride channel family protein